MRLSDPNVRLIIIAEEAAGAHALRTAADSGVQIVAVLTAGSMWSVAQEFACPCWPARLAKDPAFGETVRSERVDLILNVHSLYLIPDGVLHAARIGAFNLHPGPLPEYAGLNTVSWAIYHGAQTYGVTLHWMTAQVDLGDIAYQARFPVADTDTPVTLTHKSIRAGMPLVTELLRTAVANPATIPKLAQDPSRRRYFGKEIPERGLLSWARPAREIVNFVRACDYFPYPSPWGHPRVTSSSPEFTVLKAERTRQFCEGVPPGTVGAQAADGVLVATADEWILIRKVEVEGHVQSAEAVLKPEQLRRHARSDDAQRRRD